MGNMSTVRRDDAKAQVANAGVRWWRMTPTQREEHIALLQSLLNEPVYRFPTQSEFKQSGSMDFIPVHPVDYAAYERGEME